MRYSRWKKHRKSLFPHRQSVTTDLAATKSLLTTVQLATDFLADVCQQWEQTTIPLVESGIRVVTLRIGIVMAPDGGALAEVLPVFRKGLGGRMGNGKQYFPWIHIDDLASMICWAVKTPSIRGVLNGVAPNPVTNREYTATLAKVLNRAAMIPMPRLAMRLVLGEFADNLFLSQRVIPRNAVDAGFEFRFPELRPCLEDLL